MKNSSVLNGVVSGLIKIFPILFIVLSIPTIFGYDNDFGYYTTAAKMISSGLGMYDQVYDHKPPLYHHILIFGVYINKLFETDLFGFFCIHYTVLGTFYIGSYLFFKQICITSDIKWGYHFDLLLFSFLTATLLTFSLDYGTLNGSIVFFATSFELFAIFWLLKSFKNGLTLIDFIILGALTAGALLSRVHFGSFMAICIFLVLNGKSWQLNLLSVIKYISLTFLITMVGLYLLVSDFYSFYEAVIIDNLIYTAEKISTYPTVITTAYYAAKAHFFLIFFVLLSIFVSIYENKSFKKPVAKIRLLFFKDPIIFVSVLASTTFVVILLTKPGVNLFRYFGITPILTIGSIFIISSICSRKSLERISFLAFLTTCALYSWSFSKLNFEYWEGNQLLAKLEESQPSSANFFTADNHSWLYLKTGTIPMIKSQFLKDLTFPTSTEKKLIFTQILSTNPKFITFDALENGKTSYNENFIIQNYGVFLDQYEFKGTFKTPFKKSRLWEKKL